MPAGLTTVIDAGAKSADARSERGRRREKPIGRDTASEVAGRSGLLYKRWRGIRKKMVGGAGSRRHTAVCSLEILRTNPNWLIGARDVTGFNIKICG